MLTAKNIKITGWLSRQQVEKEMAEASLYISTALWEGLPFAVLQAMNLGKPLLLHRCIGNVDLVKNGFNGYIYDSMQDAIKRIQLFSTNKTLLQKASENSYKYLLNEFDIRKMAQSYLTIYESVSGIECIKEKTAASKIYL